jgi:hypothetical protein
MTRRSWCCSADWVVSNAIVVCILCDPHSSQDRAGVPAFILEQRLGPQIFWRLFMLAVRVSRAACASGCFPEPATATHMYALIRSRRTPLPSEYTAPKPTCASGVPLFG